MLPTKKVMQKIKDKVINLAQLLRDDLEFYSAFALKIRTKEATLIPLRFNRCQRILHDICEKMKRETGSVRIILLKFRQFGGSTYIDARGFHRTATQQNEYGKVVAHTKEAADMLFQMITRFHDHLPSICKPMASANSRGELTYSNPTKDPDEKEKNPGLGSSVSVYSAKTQGAGRGGTFRFVHCSEVPQWADPSKTMLGLLNSVPGGESSKGTEIFIESTAQGVGDYFYRLYHKAKKHDPSCEFWAVFLPWYLMDEYVNKVPANFEPNTEERELMEKQHPEWEYENPQTGDKTLNAEQIMWRRWCIATQCDNDTDKFQQEYPMTDEEAFITSGIPFFKVREVQKRLKKVAVIEPLFRGDINLIIDKDLWKAGRKLKTKKIDLTGNKYGDLSMWELPNDDHSYSWFADISEGVKGGDRSVLNIFNRNTGNQALAWKGMMDPDEFAFLIFELCHHFNWAFGSPEVNMHGFTTLKTLIDLGYPAIYQRLQIEHSVEDPTKKDGWLTNTRSRPLLLDAAKRSFREESAVINDPDTLLEMLTFVRDDNGKYQAQKGCMDDHVMAYGGACIMLGEIRAAKPGRGKRQRNRRRKNAPEDFKRNRWTGAPER